MRRRLPLLLVAGILLAAAPATAAPVIAPPPPAGYGVAIDERAFDRDGGPTVSAFVEDPTATVTWHACAPECGAPLGGGPTVAGPFRKVFLAPGTTPAGTSFEVRASVGGTTRVARTPSWGGPIAAAAPPALAGEPRIGRVVRVVPGTWSGGWDVDYDVLDLRACPTPDGLSGCVGIGPDPFGGPLRDGTATIDPVYAGWFVGPVVHRTPRFSSGGGVPPPPEDPFGTLSTRPVAAVGSARVAVGPLVGPIPAARPGSPPTVAGRQAAGSRVTATAGTWPDAPDDGVRATGLRACPTRADTARCRVLAPSGGPSLVNGSRGAATLGSDLLGWYVGAFERRGRSTGNVAPFVAPGSPGFDRPPVAGPGMVVGPLSSTPVRLGFTPRIALASSSRVAGGRVVVGRVRCASRCVVHLRVSGRGRAVARRIVVRGTARLSVSARRLPRDLRRVRSTVRIDHATTRATRTSRVR